MKRNSSKLNLWLNTVFIGLQGKIERDSRNPCTRALWNWTGFQPRERNELKRVSTTAKHKVEIREDSGETRA